MPSVICSRIGFRGGIAWRKPSWIKAVFPMPLIPPRTKIELCVWLKNCRILSNAETRSTNGESVDVGPLVTFDCSDRGTSSTPV